MADDQRAAGQAKHQNMEIIKPSKDLEEIVRSHDSAALSEFIKNAPSIIAGALIETIEHGPAAFVGPAVRVGIAALQNRGIRQFAAEVEEFRKKGKIVDDYAERRYGHCPFLNMSGMGFQLWLSTQTKPWRKTS